MKVKTFTTPLRVFHAKEELLKLDKMVNDFVEKNNVRIVDVSDTCTTDDKGATIGIIRVLAYE